MLALTLKSFYILALLWVSYTDWRWRTVPNRVMYPALLVALAAMFFQPGWGSALLGAALGGLLLFIPVVIYGPERAGIGDVKLAVFIGLILGLPHAVYALLLGFLAAAAFSLGGMLLGKLTRRSPIPLAPFLALGALAGLATI